MPYSETITYTKRDGRGKNPDKLNTYTRPRPQWHRHVYNLHRLGLNDGEIACSLGRAEQTVWKVRALLLGLPANCPPTGGVNRPVPTQNP